MEFLNLRSYSSFFKYMRRTTTVLKFGALTSTPTVVPAFLVIPQNDPKPNSILY